MITALVDTTVVIHLFRRYAPATAWYGEQSQPLALTSITWMEIVYGSSSKTNQVASKAILSQFDMIYLTAFDQRWAMDRLEALRLSHGIAINDCLIASVAYRLQLPLYSHNLKHFGPLIGELAVRPYD